MDSGLEDYQGNVVITSSCCVYIASKLCANYECDLTAGSYEK